MFSQCHSARETELSLCVQGWATLEVCNGEVLWGQYQRDMGPDATRGCWLSFGCAIPQERNSNAFPNAVTEL